jgi:hypothetical protein
LLDPATDLVDDLRAEPDHVESVEDGNRVWEAVMDGVRIPTERVKGGGFDTINEPVGLLAEPSFIDAAGTADDCV